VDTPSIKVSESLPGSLVAGVSGYFVHWLGFERFFYRDVPHRRSGGVPLLAGLA
jgi:hypothetical protein